MMIIKKFFLKLRRVSFLALLFLWLAVLFWTEPWDELKDYMIFPQNAQEISHLVYGSNSIEQTFVINGRFDSMDLLLRNYNHTQEGTCTVKLYDKSDSCIYEKEIDKSDLDDGWITLNLGQTIYAGLDSFRLAVSAPCLEKENAVEAYASNRRVYQDGVLSYKGMKNNQTLCFSVYRSRINVFAWMAVLIFLISAAAWWISRKKSFLGSSLIILAGMGACMMVMMAPMSAPDEMYHYDSSLILSNVIMGKDPLQVPSEYCDYAGFVGHYNANASFVKVIHDILPVRRQSDTMIRYKGRSNELQHPMAYLAPAVGITIGRLLGLNFIWVYYLGRACNLLLYLGLVILAVRIVPKYKELMLLTAALPMCLHQAVSYSYDVIINGTAFVFFAYVLYLADRGEEVAWKDIWILSAAGMVMCPVKIVYIALMPLVLLIPREKFGSLKRYCLMAAAVLGCTVIFAAAVQSHVISGLLIGGQTGAAAVSGKYSVWYMIDQPAGFAKMVCRTVRSGCVLWVKLCVGISLAGLSLPVDEYLILGFILILLLCCLRKDEHVWMSTRYQKIVSGLVICAGVFFIVLALMTDTFYGSAAVAGIQGRYFIPYIMPFLLCIQTNKLTADIDHQKLLCMYWILQAGVMNSILSNISY